MQNLLASATDDICSEGVVTKSMHFSGNPISLAHHFLVRMRFRFKDQAPFLTVY